MATIAEIRQKFPQYNDMSDDELAGAMHRKFYSDMPVEEFNQKIGLKAATPSDQTKVYVNAPPDDHGLARRQAMSPVEKAISPITEYWGNQQQMSGEALHQIGRGAGQVYEGAFGSGLAGDVGKFAGGLGNVALGALGYVGSPINAAYRSVVGQPIEDVTGIPREYTEFAGQLATPGLGFTKVPGARAPGAPAVPGQRIVITKPDEPPPTLSTGPSGADAAQAMQRLRDEGINIDLPRSITSDSPSVQRTGQWASNVPVVGDPLKVAAHDTVPAQIRDARDILAGQRGAATEANAAGRAGQFVSEAAAAEARAAEEAAATSDSAVLAAHQKAIDDANAAIAAREAQSAQSVEARTGVANPQDTGAQAIEALRAAEEAAKGNVRNLYDVAGKTEGVVKTEGIGGIHGRVVNDLTDAGVNVDYPNLTPASVAMLDQVKQFEALKIPGIPAVKQGESIVGMDLNGIERFRKSLRSTARNAERGSEDERAARKIIDSFDDWQNDAMQTALLSGDPKALEKFKEARSANRDWRERFGYNERNDVNNLVQKILHQDVTTKEVAEYLIGSGKVGKQGASSRLFDSLMKATGNNEELAQSIRGAIWDKLSSSPTAAKDIREFLHYSTERILAGKVFSADERALMSRHADMLDQGKAAREVVTDIAKNTQPRKVPVEKGPMQQLVAHVVGGKVDKPEALWKTIEGYTTKGGDVGALARLMRELPPEMKGDIAGAVVRGLGDSARTGQFSLDTFASDWGRITPQAKQILFGNDGAHVKALDDIALLSQRLKDVQKKYGNPSGTAQNTALTTLFSTLTGVVGGTGSPWAAATMLGTAAGGYLGARILAKPATASSIAKHMKAVERAAENPTAQNLSIASMTERNMLNTIKTLGAARAPQSGPSMRLLQGPVPAGAENEQR